MRGESTAQAVRALWGLVALVCLGACGGDGEPSATGAGDAEPTPGGTAVVALTAEPDVLNPLIRNTAAAGYILSVITDALVEMGEDLTWGPRIARHWTVAPDSLSITYRLRPWFWEDGAPLTSHDAVLSLELFKDPRVASPQRGFFAAVIRATALDDSTLRYDFAAPLPDPVTRTAHPILPRHLVAAWDPAEVGAWVINTSPLASGEFTLDRWERNRQLVLVRNSDHPLEAPLLHRVVFRVLPEMETRVLALEAGEVDFVDNLPARDARRLEEQGLARIVATSGRRIYYLQWNCARAAFADARTRKALSLALDRDLMIATLMAGYARPAASPVAPAVWNHDRELAADALDRPRARALLAEAGWRDADGDGFLERAGEPLRCEILARQGDPVRENGVVILREHLQAVGVEVTVRLLEQGAALARLERGEFDAYFGLLNLNLYGDPSSWVHSEAVDRFNKGAYANARVDSLLAVALATGERERAWPAWRLLQETLAADPPAAYLFYPEVLVAVGPRLRGVRPHVLSPYNNLAQWWIPSSQRRYRDGP